MFSKILLAIDFSGVSTLLVEHLSHLLKVGLQEAVLAHVVNLRDAGISRKIFNSMIRRCLTSIKLKSPPRHRQSADWRAVV